MFAQSSAGYIVNTASFAGLIASSGPGIYKVTRHGVVALSETLALELRRRKWQRYAVFSSVNSFHKKTM